MNKRHSRTGVCDHAGPEKGELATSMPSLPWTTSELRGRSRCVLHGNVDGREHPMYGGVKAYIDGHPLPYRESYYIISCHPLEEVYPEIVLDQTTA